MSSVEPTNKPETKVSAATFGAFAASIGVAILNGVNEYGLLAGVPAFLQTLLVLVIPALVTFLSGYAAPHTSR